MPTTTKKTSKKTTQADVPASLKTEYKTYVLTHGHEPTSVFLFTQHAKIKEEDFYKYYGSFNAIQKEIWNSFIADTLSSLKSEKIYKEYTSREKLLAFYFTLMEHLKKDRSYVKYAVESKLKKPELMPAFLKEFRSTFISYVEGLIHEGLEKEEISKRPFFTDKYKDALWLQFIFVLGFWLRDDSANFDKTDAAIEKSVNLAFELMSGGPVDQMIDLAKFIYQNR